LITVRKTTTWVLALGLLLALCVLAIGKPSEATTVTPDLVPDNPNCAGPAGPHTPDLGYANGFKPQPEPPPTGTYSFPGDPDNSVTITSDGTNFDWTSTLGIDAVIVKGGDSANVYKYDPESMGDTGLKPPLNNGGQQAGISHIEFCYDYEVKVSKTAKTSLDRTYTWDIKKTADQTDLTLQPNQSSPLINYKVTLSNTSADSNWAVNGVITIKNPDPNNPATGTDVKDEISGVNDAAAVDCGEPLPFTIQPGASKDCSYSSPLPDGANRTNTATVTTSDESKVGGGSGTADVKFDNNTTVKEIDGSVNVDDTFKGPLGTVSAKDAPKDLTYTREVSFDKCGEYKVDNTASFVTNDTGATGSASWTVNVHVPCQSGCTLTMGYWKTHADPNSPRHDNTQTLKVLAAAQPPITVGGNAVTATPGTYNVVSLLSFSGDASKPINKLYAQSVAAKLNIANGADGSAVSTTITNADAFLTGKSPNQNLTNAQKQTAVSLAATLENFNSGGIGPGHCNEPGIL
jgi:hypothetical protein